MSNIHPYAIIEEGAVIEDGVTVEPFAVVKKNVTLKKDVVVKSHAYIEGNTTIGENSVIWPSAVIGAETQDKKYAGETTYVEIGKNCSIRECVTINSSTGEGSVVKIGDDCLIMAYCHIAHNCEVGNGVTMSNNATLAGHVIVEDYAIIGGLTPVHQFVRIGKLAMVGGLSRILRDVPPYTVGGGIPYKLGGINQVGLKRRNFDLESRKRLARAYRYVYRSGLTLEEALGKIEIELEDCEEIREWVNFCRNSTRGLVSIGEAKARSNGEKLQEADS
ncbi:MAG: acyl-ACP--UDP-N-acetylglucosamine O-acyltransferase [Chlamydiales bacterium]|nr:acyl-ACP--UDP-N-acetylglucosamine O-acyltransferase [Chlamydiales bacterium]